MLSQSVPPGEKHARVFSFVKNSLATLVSVTAMTGFAAVAPYSPDAQTLQLWHFDEADVPVLNAVTSGTNLTALSGGATLNHPAFPGFGNALSTFDEGPLGATRDAALAAVPLVNGAEDDVPLTLADPLTGAFTFEALVRVDFDPTQNLAARGSGMQIFSGDGDSSSDRVFQWRLMPVGLAAGVSSDTARPRLEFINLRQGGSIQFVVFNIPTNGPNAIVSHGWFHVALTYDGNENTASNFRAYWTALEGGATAANLIGTANLANDLSVAGCDFVIGNEGRAISGSTDNFVGLIDEVRISSVARATNEFVFRSVVVLEASSYEAGSTNFPTNTRDGNLNSRWSALGDGEWITFDLGRSELVQSVSIAFYLGNARTSTFDVLLSSDNANWQTVLTNATSSGATVDLETFDFSDFPARYVRIVGHGNSQSLWNSYTEVTVESVSVADSDADGLPDSWEVFYFNNLTFGATNDADLDLYDNLAEYSAGSNPTNALSTPLDRDADLLPDAWELQFFNSLTQTAAGDFDNDGYSNLAEHDAETNPASAASNPGDTDADGLPDAWEMTHFKSLAQRGSDDFDGDGFANRQEFLAGTNPASNLSFPSGPAVNYVPIEDGDPNTSEFGYAGSSAINSVNFVRKALHTENGQQFIAYYFRHATSASNTNNNRIVIGRRDLNASLWQLFFTPFTANAITDGHDVASFGIDGAGYMHLSWGMHGDAFHYSRSTAPVFGTNAIVFGPDTTMTGRENTVTYPQWLRLPDGDLLYLFREGASGNGDTYLNRYYVSSQTWSNVHRSGSTQLPFLKGTGWSPNYNAYPNMPQVDAAGNFYLIWTWRYQGDSPAGESGYQTNHDFDFARSTNGGLTWLRQDGTPYALPISERGENGNPATMAEEILSIPEGYSLINQAGMCLDQNNWPVIATWWAPGTATNNFRRQYMVAFRDELGVWQTRQVSHRTNDPIGTKYSETFVRNLGRPVIVCDSVGRLVVLYRDNFGSNGLTIVHSLPYAVDPQRTNWFTFDLTTDNLGNYEPVNDEARWALDQQLHILHQPSQGEGYTPPANTAAEIAVVEWNAATYFAHRPVLNLSFAQGTNAVLHFNAQTGWGYRVQASTNLGAWDTLATLPGVMGQLSYTHTNAVGAEARYWRVESREGGFKP